MEAIWLATQRNPQNDWTATQNRVNYDVLAQAPLMVMIFITNHILHVQFVPASDLERPPIAPRVRRRKQSPWQLMRSQLELLFHDVTMPVACVRYLLERNHLSEVTAQLIVSQESDLESWDLLLTSLESHECTVDERLECFKEALSFAEEISLLERIEEELCRHGDREMLTSPVSQEASEPMLPSVASKLEPQTGKVVNCQFYGILIVFMADYV